MSNTLTPREIVIALDRHIIGQQSAKKAVAVAIRNRWRRQQLPEQIRKDITPKNIILIGPTGVGKTEVARRLAQLVGAPFLKVEATKFTEIGYVGRDVESMVRDLVEVSIGLVKQRQKEAVHEKAQERVTERLLDLLVPTPKSATWEPEAEKEENERRQRTRDKFREKLTSGEMEDRVVELTKESRGQPMPMFTTMSMESMDMNFSEMFEKIMPKSTPTTRQVTIREARKVLLEQESEALLDQATLAETAIELAENQGIIFLDEIDKICAGDGGSGAARGGEVSRQGVQRDLLPIVEGTTVKTKYGPVKTDHVLFIAAGAFHISKPADLMPELQGRFPIRVELSDLTREDFLRVLTEPEHALTKQYQELLSTEGITLEFTHNGIEALAELAFELNRSMQNIGARRLHTLLERVVEDISFEGPDLAEKAVRIDAALVREKVGTIAAKDDTRKYIL
jgi:ATP-dependent HslUV protease ATP-binding subunit HslU